MQQDVHLLLVLIELWARRLHGIDKLIVLKNALVHYQLEIQHPA